MSPDTIRTIVGIIGNLLACGLFISPVPTFWKIFRRKDVEDFSPIPYLATLLNCALWLFYGFVHPNSLLIVTINGFGLVVEFLYIIMFFIYGKHRLRMLGILAVEAVFMGVVIPIVLLAGHTVETRSKIVGCLCVSFGTCCMYALSLSPSSVMKLVIMTESVKYMPFFLSLAGCLNGIDWMIYGLIHFDTFVVLTSGSVALLGLAQLILYGCYYKSAPKDDDEPNAEMELPTTQPAGRS